MLSHRHSDNYLYTAVFLAPVTITVNKMKNKKNKTEEQKGCEQIMEEENECEQMTEEKASPVVRKRGRPKKVFPERRGRPRKNPESSPKKAPTVVRGPGRPKKVLTGKRGRPRKNPESSPNKAADTASDE